MAQEQQIWLTGLGLIIAGLIWHAVAHQLVSALSLLKVAELNGQWQQLWFPAQAA